MTNSSDPPLAQRGSGGEDAEKAWGEIVIPYIQRLPTSNNKESTVLNMVLQYLDTGLTKQVFSVFQ